MTRYGPALSLSLLVHLMLGIVLLLVLPLKTERNASIFVPLQLAPMAQPKQTTSSAPPVQTHKPLRPEAEKVPRSEPEPETPPPASLLRRPTLQRMLAGPVRPATDRDSLLAARMEQWRSEIPPALFDPAQIPAEDPINRDANPIAKMTAPEAVKPPKAKTPRLDFIPTEDQCKALNYLFAHGEGTQLDIYPGLETETPVTAAHFDRSLEKLYDKGLVQREKISPENLLLIATPVGAVPVETSAKNRRNPVYQYSINVDRSLLLAYLDSRLLSVEERLVQCPADSSALKRERKRLQSRIALLRQAIRRP